MPNVHVQVTIPHTSGLERDSAINTFAFIVTTIDEFTGLALEESLETFYNGLVDLQTDPICNYISNVMSRVTPMGIKIWEIAPILGEPLYDSTMDPLGAGAAGNGLPNEVALCLSYKNTDTAVALPAGRKRGRVYIGPLHQNTLGAGGGLDQRPSSVFMEDVIEAGEALADNSNHQLAVWSRASGAVTPVTDMWVDNEWDTQRRRGLRATARLTRAGFS